MSLYNKDYCTDDHKQASIQSNLRGRKQTV